MLRWMLRVDNWLDVAPLENMEEDHSFLFLKKNLMKIFFFFWIRKTWIFRRNWKFWIFFFFLEKFRNLDLLKEFGNFYWIFVHWRFFLWNMVLEIFPLKNEEFSFWKWRFIYLFLFFIFYDHKVKKMKIN